jgi:hypothetical protein
MVVKPMLKYVIYMCNLIIINKNGNFGLYDRALIKAIYFAFAKPVYYRGNGKYVFSIGKCYKG